MAVVVLDKTGSVALSNLVIATPWILPVIGCKLIHYLSSRYSPQAVTMTTTGLGCLTCLAATLSVPRYVAGAFLIIAIIGLVDAIQRVERFVVIKIGIAPSVIESTVPITLSAQFIGGITAGILFTLIEPTTDMPLVLGLSAFGFLSACLSGFLFPGVGSPAWQGEHANRQLPGSLMRLISMLRDDLRLHIRFALFVALTILFQGYYNLTRVALPASAVTTIDTSDMVGYLQITASGAALLGALLYYKLPKCREVFGGLGLTFSGALLMVTLPMILNGRFLITAYFLYILIFELIFFSAQSKLVKAAKTCQISLIITYQYAFIYSGMAVLVLFGSMLLPKIELLGVSAATANLTVIFLFVNSRTITRLNSNDD